MKAAFAQIILLGSTLFSEAPHPERATFELKETILLEGVEGRIDHLVFDAQNKRLYVAALGNNTVEVIDVTGKKRIAQIKDIQRPQGLCLLPESGILVVTSGGDGKCRFFDKEQKPLGTIDKLAGADNIRYDSKSKLLYVGYGSGALAIIDPEKHEKLADIPLPAHPESFHLETVGKRIFINLPDSKQVAVVDRENRNVVASWPVPEASENFPMALDEKNHRLFLGCRNPARLLVLDTETGKLVDFLQCGGDADDLFQDSHRRLYVSCGEGLIAIYLTNVPDYPARKDTMKTRPGARTCLWVQEEGILWVACPRWKNESAELRAYQWVSSK